MPQCAATTSLCRYLEWDSQFFGRRIARVSGNRLTIESLREIQDWCDSQRIDCLYFLADSADAPTVTQAENAGFHLVDVRLTLAAGRLVRTEERLDSVRPFRPDDLPGLRAIARVSHRDSRFYYDGNFAQSQCDALYETWIEKSTQGYAQAVLVAELAGQPAGYVSCHIEGAAGQIGLFAVADRAQGRGIGRQLVLASLDWFAEHNASEVTVVTQGRNIPAQRLYQKCGFSSRSLELWYHYWRAVPPNRT